MKKFLRRRRDDGGSLVEIEGDVALEMDRVGEIISGGEEDGAASGDCGSLDGFVDGSGVYGAAVAGCAVLPHVVGRLGRLRWGGVLVESMGWDGAGDAEARAALERHAERFAKSLATVVNVLDPDAVVGAGIAA